MIVDTFDTLSRLCNVNALYIMPRIANNQINTNKVQPSHPRILSKQKGITSCNQKKNRTMIEYLEHLFAFVKSMNETK